MKRNVLVVDDDTAAQIAGGVFPTDQMPLDQYLLVECLDVVH